jgi:hypothetical protein
LRSAEDRLPDGKLYQDVLALRLMVDRAIEERQQQRV